MPLAIFVPAFHYQRPNQSLEPVGALGSAFAVDRLNTTPTATWYRFDLISGRASILAQVMRTPQRANICLQSNRQRRSPVCRHNHPCIAAMNDAAWQRDFRQAQTVKTYCINSRRFKRIPYGGETNDWGAELHNCTDCGVTKSRLHLLGCDVEQCPCCGGCAVACGCSYDDRPGSV